MRGRFRSEIITTVSLHMYRKCTVCLTLLYKESQAGSVRRSLCTEEDWVYNSPFLFILILFFLFCFGFFSFFAGFFSSGSRFYVF